MKKIIYFLFFLTYFPCIMLLGQTTMTSPQNLGNVKVWDVKSSDTLLGKVYTIEKGADCKIVFSPNQKDLSYSIMIVTGTYTSDSMKVAGNAYENCKQIGNPNDKYFKPNAYLVSQNGTISFSNQPGCNSIQVYKLIDSSSILSDVVNARVKQPVLWRFFVEKKWTKEYQNGTEENGTDLLIVDFDTTLTLSKACAYVKDLERNTTYQNFSYISTITACLLDTGMFRPFLLNEASVDGTFPTQQSNVIIVMP